MPRLLVRRAAATALVAASIFSVAASALEGGRQGGIAFLAGGVGLEERERMQAQEAAYSTRLVFAGSGGAYIAAPHVDIHRGDDLVFSLTVDGPWLLVNLPPGRYVVTANARGDLRRREITVPATGRASFVFQWEDGPDGAAVR